MAVKQTVTKTVNITNQINDDKGTAIVTQSAAIDAAHNLSLNKYISNYDLYFANKTEIRKMLSDFEDMAYTEAETLAEKEGAETTEGVTHQK